VEYRPTAHADTKAALTTASIFPSMKIDLTPFCARPEANRYQIESPWSRGKWTYATDGKIVVRIPRDPEVPDNKLAPSAMPLFTAHFKDACAFQPFEETPLLGAERLKIGGRILSAKYLRLIAALPEAEIATDFGTTADPLPFRFARGSGHGLVMPIKAAEVES
jgi:hypothetical protein